MSESLGSAQAAQMAQFANSALERLDHLSRGPRSDDLMFRALFLMVSCWLFDVLICFFDVLRSCWLWF